MSIMKYSSRNEDSLLKSFGPHVIEITSQKITDFEPGIMVVSTPRIFGVIETYGEVLA
jgi:hypothetical protein